jgi:hypothetical protein
VGRLPLAHKHRQQRNWFVSGASDARFSDDDLDQLKAIPGTAFEVIKLGMLYK